MVRAEERLLLLRELGGVEALEIGRDRLLDELAVDEHAHLVRVWVRVRVRVRVRLRRRLRVRVGARARARARGMARVGSVLQLVYMMGRSLLLPMSLASTARLAAR